MIVITLLLIEYFTVSCIMKCDYNHHLYSLAVCAIKIFQIGYLCCRECFNLRIKIFYLLCLAQFKCHSSHDNTLSGILLLLLVFEGPRGMELT